MSELTNSLLLSYILKMANSLNISDSRKRISANQFLIVILNVICEQETNQLPEEINLGIVKPEIDALLIVLNGFEFDKQIAIKGICDMLGNKLYNSSMDELLFNKIIQYTAVSRAKHDGKPELSADVVLQLILAEPTEAIKKYIINANKTEANSETDISGKSMSSQLEDLLSSFDKDKKGDGEGDKAEKSGDAAEAPNENDGEANKVRISELVNKVKQTQTTLLNSVFGQDHAVNTFTSGYFQAELLSLTNKKRIKPRGTFLFAGPPGVGKTFLAEKAAEVLDLPFKRFDMSEYSDKEANLEFCGSDNVYKNAKAGNVTNFVDDNPKCILLFDEIEKAHINVIHLFLQMLDAGRLRDNFTDTEVSFTDAIIIFTTNAGKKLYTDSPSSNLSGLSRKTILKALEADINSATGTPFFPAAICSRFASGNVVMLNDIEAHNLMRIAKNEILCCAENIEKTFGIKTTIDEEVYAAILFGEGGSADARTVKSRAEAFYHGELFELFRLIASEKTENSIEGLEKVHFSVELPQKNESIRALFSGQANPEILLFGSEKAVSLCQNKGKKFKFHSTDDIETAKELLMKYDIELILCDIQCGMKCSDSKLLNVEDVDSSGRDFFWLARTTAGNTPIYLLQTENGIINAEEELSFTREGARGVITVTENRNDGFNKNMLVICDALHQQNSMLILSKANKVVTFETAQSISDDGKTAEIRLFDFEMNLAVDADDSQNILSNISKPNVMFNQIIGAKDAKEELSYFIEYLKNPKKYIGKGLKSPKGVLLYGPPGTGKTMLAKAMAGESNVTFITAEGNQFLKKYVGEGPETVHNLFNVARKYAPSILFVDEIDAIAKERGNGEAQISADEVLNAFLSEMDGFKTDPSKPVFVLAATNFSVEPGTERRLDTAMLRRFDRRIFVDLPDKQECIQFLKLKIAHNDAMDISDSMIDNIAIRSTGMSLASLESVIELALRTVVRTGGYKVTEEVLEEAFETFNSGEAKKWNVAMLERTARHEAGHAYICWSNGETPSYITIVARSNHGGYMQHGDNESKGIYVKDELLGRIRTALAGRAAEVVYYGDKDGISTGASGDLQSATSIAWQLICYYGMDEQFGMATLSNKQGQSDVLTAEVRERINAILSDEYEKAKKIISDHRKAIDSLVKELLVKNHLSGDEIKSFFEAANK